MSAPISAEADPLTFRASKTAGSADDHVRLGTIAFGERPAFPTPHYLALTSRGCVPHMTPDMMQDHTAIRGVYAAFEDYAERFPAALPAATIPCPPTASPLRRFVALPAATALVLGPRRVPAVASSASNADGTLGICTAIGHRLLSPFQYADASMRHLRPDVVIGACDIEGSRADRPADWPGRRRAEKMEARTTKWVDCLARSVEKARKEQATEEGAVLRPAAWVPILPLEAERQAEYLAFLAEHGLGSFDGTVVYEPDNLPDVPEPLRSRPRLSLAYARSPQRLLRAIALGADLVVAPFVTAASEAGLALSFSFPPPSAPSPNPPSTDGPSVPRSLALDLGPAVHATDMAPIEDGCGCHVCASYSRAYVRHLLAAREMTAWVLLQVHNHAVLDRFFAGVRGSIEKRTFEEDRRAFERAYESELPASTNEGPRVRGYQSSQVGPKAEKLNKAPFKKLAASRNDGSSGRSTPRGEARALDEGREKLAESADAQPLPQDADGKDLEDMGFASLYEQKE